MWAGQQDSTRRGFVAGVTTGAAVQVAGGSLLSGFARADEVKRCAPTPPGVRVGAMAPTPSGRTIWTADAGATTITAYRRRDLLRGRSIDVGATPAGLAIGPDGLLALVTTAFYDRPGLVVVDLRTREIDRLDVAAEPGAVAFSRSGRRAYVVGGGPDGTLTRVDPATGRLGAPIALGAQPRGLVLHPDGRHALVALNAESAVAVVDLRKARVTRRIATAAFPAQLAIAPDGTRALVTHNGFGARRATPLDLVRWRAGKPVPTGLDPAGVAYDRTGTVAFIACAGDGTVTALRRGRRRRLRPGGAPRFVAAIGRRAIVADGDTGQLTAIRLTGGN